MQPLDVYFDVGGHGSEAPYSDAFNAILKKHTEEIDGKAAADLGPPTDWKRRIRDYMAYQNTELLEFLNLKVKDHTTLSEGEALLRRFGNPQVTPSHPSVREFVLDTSGEDVLGDISTAIENFRGQGGLKDYMAATRLIFEEYKAAGEGVLSRQEELREKLDRLDEVQNKVRGLFEIEVNEEREGLMEAGERYLKRVYEKNRIEEAYKAFIAAYRRFTLLRGVIEQSRDLYVRGTEPLCTICFQDPVAFAAAPCGHTFCGPCLRKHGVTCCLCRGEIRDKVKLFFG
jgi:hypothetical protein